MSGGTSENELDPNEILRRVSRALGDPHRVTILHLLREQGELSCGTLVEAVGLAQATVSHHLKELVDAGLVTVRPEKQRSLFTLRSAAIANYAALLCDLLGPCPK